MLEERLTELEGAQTWSPRLVSKLETSIRTGDDLELFRINPYRYAADRDLEPTEVLDLFLHAAKVGLFTMDWMIVCASCANVFNTFRALEKLEPRFVCDLCSMDNDTDLDDHIQVGFTISADVREIVYHDPARLSPEDLYFQYHFSNDVKPLPTGVTLPQILEQWTKLLAYLEPGETRSIDVDVPRGALSIRDVVNSASALYMAVPELGPEETTLDLVLARGELRDPDHELAPFALEYPEGTFVYPAAYQIPHGSVAIHVRNDGTERASVWVVLYEAVPDQLHLIEFEPVLSGKRLLSTQTFRRLFRSETVPASETLEIKDLTYLFTDLEGSTAMYDAVGDANAYNLVRSHFDALGTVVEASSGAVVKTIGDAVMATFVTAADGVRAAADMLSRLADFNETNSTDLILKIGIHRGHSIAVTLNDRIDYFGQSVNIASRVQQLAGAGEIVLTGDVYREHGVAEIASQFEVTEESGIMKGVEEVIPVYRLTALAD